MCLIPRPAPRGAPDPARSVRCEEFALREFKDNIITNETITQVVAESTIIDESTEITIDILENKIAEKIARIFP